MSIRQMTAVGVLAAAAAVVMIFVQFPILPSAPYLQYDPSDAVALLGGLMLGPGPGVVTVALKDLLFWLIKGGHPLGPLADFIAAGVFVAVSAAFYRRLVGSSQMNLQPVPLAAALLLGTAARVVVMVLANFPILYLEFGMAADRVAALLGPAIIPFNGLKGLLNGVMTLVLAAALMRRQVVLALTR